MKKNIFMLWILGSFFLGNICYAKEEDKEVGSLYSQSAVLMDGESGRVLYGKRQKEFLANASTTKILTCILALELGKPEDIVTVSAYAASMPAVKLQMREAEQYRLLDLLYSLMLESHNDTAVAIAEHVAGSCEKFAVLMNEKAKEIGCENSCFLTPNGLDAKQRVGQKEEEQWKEHGTTAQDLALIMRYCIKISCQKEKFIEITQTPSYSFSDMKKKRTFTCRNHNSFLQMMEGVVSGKTGFTSKAGYCYVGALEREGKTYIVALLACGWPGNKNYKWKDCRQLLEYGLKYYETFSLETLEKEYEKKLFSRVKNAKRSSIDQDLVVQLRKKQKNIKSVLVKEGETITVRIQKKKLEAPVEAGKPVGKITYYIAGDKWMEEALYCSQKAEKIDFKWCLKILFEKSLKLGKKS